MSFPFVFIWQPMQYHACVCHTLPLKTLTTLKAVTTANLLEKNYPERWITILTRRSSMKLLLLTELRQESRVRDLPRKTFALWLYPAILVESDFMTSLFRRFFRLEKENIPFTASPMQVWLSIPFKRNKYENHGEIWLRIDRKYFSISKFKENKA